MHEPTIPVISTHDTPVNDPAFLLQAPEEPQEDLPPPAETEPASASEDGDVTSEEEFDEEELIIEDFTIDGICGVY